MLGIAGVAVFNKLLAPHQQIATVIIEHNKHAV